MLSLGRVTQTPSLHAHQPGGGHHGDGDGDAVHLAAALGADRERALVPGQPAHGGVRTPGGGPTASAVAASGSETSLHSLAPQTFAELISVASKASLSSKGSNSQATALGGTSRGSTATAARSQFVLGIPASDRRLTSINALATPGFPELTPLRPVWGGYGCVNSRERFERWLNGLTAPIDWAAVKAWEVEKQ